MYMRSSCSVRVAWIVWSTLGHFAARGHCQVQISELLPAPIDGPDLEYVEILNAGSAPVDLTGWAFTRGIRLVLAPVRPIEPGECFLVARNPAAAATTHGLPADRILGPYRGALDDNGERVTLVDPGGHLADTLAYSNRYPFNATSLEEGQALHRACLDSPADAPFNWRFAAPSPGVPPREGPCPPAPPSEDPALRPIILNEIQYHAAGPNERALELIELHNRGQAAVSLEGWKLDRGIQFTFPPGTTLPAGGYLLCASDPAGIAAKLALDPALVLGPFAGGTTLSNSGERVRLVDALGVVQDEVHYEDHGAWPAQADGLGASLQRVDPLGPSGSPGNWRTAAPPGSEAGDPEWQSFRIEGPHDGPRFYFYLLGAGEALLDDVRLELKDGDGASLLPNGTFDEGWTGWSGTGNHLASHAETTGGFGNDGPCGRLVATGEGNGAQNGVRQTLTAIPPKGAPCVLTFRIKAVSGEQQFIARSSVASATNGLLHVAGNARTGSLSGLSTPLKPNLVGGGSAPPAILEAKFDPSWPTSSQPVAAIVQVLGPEVTEVLAHVAVGKGNEEVFALQDNGTLPDEVAGDGRWSADLPPRPDGSLVWVRFTARTRGGAESRYPPIMNPSETVGYYVVDDAPAQNEDLRLFYIFTPGALRDLSCNDLQYVVGDFVDFRGRAYRNVGVKHRGETACSYPKRPIRVRFNKGDQFEGQSHLNFNAGWNDKSMLREKFGFDFFRDAGCAYSETHLARVHTNLGKFHGAYFTVEEPSEAYLKRNRRTTDGGLYKCRTAMLSGGTGGYEPRTDTSAADLPHVSDFAGRLSTTNGQPLIDLIKAEVDVDAMFDYQAVQVIIIDGDSVVKNWLLFHGRHELDRPGPPLFTAFPWDIDLSYGQMLLTTDVRNYDIHPLFQTQTYPFHDQGYHGLLNALLQRAPNDYFVRAFYGRMWHLLEEKFNEAVLFPKLDRFEANTGPTVREDLRAWPRWGTRSTDPDYWRNDFRTFIQRRRAHLTKYLTSLNLTTQGRKLQYVPAPRVKITEINYNPAHGRQDLELIELTNLEETPVPLGGWTIPLLAFDFPTDQVLPPGGSVLVARNPTALRATYNLEGTTVLGPYSGSLPGDGGVLRIYDDGAGGAYYPEVVDGVVYEDGGAWPSGADGEGFSLELMRLDADNDDPASWRAGWSPGHAARANAPPVAAINVSTRQGLAPLNVRASGLASTDPDDTDLEYLWSTTPTVPVLLPERAILDLTFELPGSYTVTLTVTDRAGERNTQEVLIEVLPGEAPGFRRGDSNADTRTDLSDAVYTLRYLFLGEEAPLCADAADVDDDGKLGITDAVYLLNFLFQAGSPVAPPGSQTCGPDPTADALSPCLPDNGCAAGDR